MVRLLLSFNSHKLNCRLLNRRASNTLTILSIILLFLFKLSLLELDKFSSDSHDRHNSLAAYLFFKLFHLSSEHHLLSMLFFGYAYLWRILLQSHGINCFTLRICYIKDPAHCILKVVRWTILGNQWLEKPLMVLIDEVCWRYSEISRLHLQCRCYLDPIFLLIRKLL